MGLNYFFYLYTGSAQIFINYEFTSDFNKYYWQYDNSYSSETIFIPYGNNLFEFSDNIKMNLNN